MTEDSIEISTPEQYGAFAHPLRQRILFALGEPATISQLAVRLEAQKGSIAHHLKVLAAAGLVRLGQTRKVRGGTEQYYERGAKKLRFGGPQVTAVTASSLRSTADEMANAPAEPYLIQRRLRLTEAQLQQLISTMESVVEGLEEADEGEIRHAVLMGVFQTP